MKKKYAIRKPINVIAILILLIGVVFAYYVYQTPSKQSDQLVVNEWGVKFKNDSNKYSYDGGLSDFILINDKALSEKSGLCGSVIYTYYRVLISDIESPKADTTKLEKLEFIKSIDGYNYYLESQEIPDFCGEELAKSKENFNTEIYEIK